MALIYENIMNIFILVEISSIGAKALTTNQPLQLK